MFTGCGGRNFQKAVFGMLIISYLNIMHKKRQDKNEVSQNLSARIAVVI